jgi:lysozyme
MKTSQEGVELIKKFEGCELKPYYCSGNVLTIGYGHTGSDVNEKSEITEDMAEQILKEDLEKFEKYVSNLVEVELTQCQFDALVAWTFNLGPTNLSQSTLLKRLNSKNFDDVPFQIKRWNKAGGKVLEGLVRRREAESLLFKGEPWENV